MPNFKMCEELGELDADVRHLVMGVENLVETAVHALTEHDAREFSFGESDRSLAEEAHRLAERCRRILLLYQPVAVDFRRVTAVLQMTSDLEPIGHLASGIARRAADLAATPFDVPDTFSRMAASVAGMIRSALDASERAPDLARKLRRALAEVSECAKATTESLTTAMKADPSSVESGLNLFAMVGDLQRIADHALGLAKQRVSVTQDRSARPVTRLAPVSPVRAHSIDVRVS
jgi:phosphate transport system protein